jgi:4-hydroxythreonine-4-phosphate dehydrogenase
MRRRRRLALTQGDPAGIGPEILLKLLFHPAPAGSTAAWEPILVAERAALEALRPVLPEAPWDRLRWLASPPSGEELDALAAADLLPVLDPVGAHRELTFGRSGPADAAGAMAALDAGMGLVRSGAADALVTAPVSKESIARQHLPGFKGHTDYLAEACGLERYGRDYLMAFLAPDLQVALLTVHEPLRDAIAAATDGTAIAEALDCLHRHAGGKIALAGLNPHAGENSLLGEEDGRYLVPAVAAARARGLDVHGPESADSLFARARRGEFDWIMALYHDQGLIAVKTSSFGLATNWTLGLPFLRTSVDHGTAFPLAGTGKADAAPLAAVVETTLALIEGTLPKKRPAS